MSTAILMLNANGEALRVISLQRALSLLMNNKVDVLETVPDKKLRSPSVEIPYPSVLRLKRFVNVPRRNAVWSRRAVFARDNWRCVYCNDQLDRTTATVDHLIPRDICDRMGVKASTWSNTCASCPKCNRRKANKRLEDSGMKFYNADYLPKIPRTSYIVFSGDVPSQWRAYLRI